MNPPTKEQLVARRARKGANPADSAALLEEVLATGYSSTALASVLVYEGFATERQAEAFASAAFAEQVAISKEIIAELIAEEG